MYLLIKEFQKSIRRINLFKEYVDIYNYVDLLEMIDTNKISCFFYRENKYVKVVLNEKVFYLHLYSNETIYASNKNHYSFLKFLKTNGGKVLKKYIIIRKRQSDYF